MANRLVFLITALVTVFTTRICADNPANILTDDLNKWRDQLQVNKLKTDEGLVSTAKNEAQRSCEDTDYQLPGSDVVRVLTTRTHDLAAKDGLYNFLKGLNADGKKDLYSCGDSENCRKYFLLTNPKYEKVGIAYHPCDNAGPKYCIAFVFSPKGTDLMTDPKFLDFLNDWRGRLAAVDMNKLTQSDDTKTHAILAAKKCVQSFYTEKNVQTVTILLPPPPRDDLTLGLKMGMDMKANGIRSTGKLMKSDCGGEHGCSAFVMMGRAQYEYGTVAFYHCEEVNKGIFAMSFQFKIEDSADEGIIANLNPNNCKCANDRRCEEKVSKGKVTSRLCLKVSTTTMTTTTATMKTTTAETTTVIAATGFNLTTRSGTSAIFPELMTLTFGPAALLHVVYILHV